MINLIFTDIITKETYKVSCESYLIHNIETIDHNLKHWCIGRILLRTEIPL